MGACLRSLIKARFGILAGGNLLEAQLGILLEAQKISCWKLSWRARLSLGFGSLCGRSTEGLARKLAI